MNIGFIISSKGSSFIELHEFISKNRVDIEVFVVVDRDTSLECYCEKNHIKYRKIIESDNKSFSEQSVDFFRSNNVGVIFLFFSRLLDKVIFRELTSINFHPSILPLYTGFGAIERAINGGDFFIGCTAHIVDESIDCGKKIAQIINPIYFYKTEDEINRLSFMQKNAILFMLVDNLVNDAMTVSTEGSVVYHNEARLKFNSNISFYSELFSVGFAKLEDKYQMKVLHEL